MISQRGPPASEEGTPTYCLEKLLLKLRGNKNNRLIRGVHPLDSPLLMFWHITFFITNNDR